MCRLRNIAMRDYQESAITTLTDRQSDPYVPLCFAGDTKGGGGLNSAYFMPQQHFREYFRYPRKMSLKFSKFNLSAAISNICAQFAPVNKGLNSAYFMFQQLFESTSCMLNLRH